MRRTLCLAALAALSCTGCAGLQIPRTGAPPPPTALILVDLPPGIREGAHLAIDVANSETALDNGVHFKAVDISDTLDGQYSPGAAVQHFRQLVDGPQSAQILGLVGPADSDVARRELPFASLAELPVFSPDITGPCFTQDHTYCTRGEPESLYPKGRTENGRGQVNFFRIPATTAAEGPAAADYAYNNLNKRTAFVVEDGSSYGNVIGDDFQARFTGDGGDMGATDTKVALPNLDAAKGEAAKILTAHPDVVFYAGMHAEEAGRLDAALQGSNVAFLTTDSIDSSKDFLAAAGPAAEGAYAFSLEPNAAYAAAVPGSVAALFYQLYTTRYPQAKPVPGFALNSYIGAWALVQAIRQATTTPTGQAIALPLASDLRAALAGGSGVTGALTVALNVDVGDNYGSVSFDSVGDDIDKVITVDTVKGGAWAFKDQVNFAG